MALQEALDLSLPELSALWAELDTFVYEDRIPSQYDRAFLDEALFPDTSDGTGLDLRNDIFALRPDRADLAVTTSTDAAVSPWLARSDGMSPARYTLQPDYAAYVQTATQLTADDLLMLVAEQLPKDAGTGHVALNLANLSWLYRAATHARALGVTPRDAQRLVPLTGVRPLSGATKATPAHTKQFSDLFASIDAGGHTVEQLAYLLLHEPTAAAMLQPTAAAAAAWLASAGPTMAGILTLDDERITTDVQASLARSLGASLGVDPEALTTLLFTSRPALGRELVANVIAAGNPDATGPSAPAREFADLFTQVHKFGLAWTGLALSRDFLPFVLDHGPALGWVDLAALPSPHRPAGTWSRGTGSRPPPTCSPPRSPSKHRCLRCSPTPRCRPPSRIRRPSS